MNPVRTGRPRSETFVWPSPSSSEMARRNARIEEDKILDLQEHSLNAVIASCKYLWCPPERWQPVHLKTLGVQRLDDEEMKRLVPALHAVIPKLSPSHLQDMISLMTRRTWGIWGPDNAGAVALGYMFAFPSLPPRACTYEFESGAHPFAHRIIDIIELELIIGMCALKLAKLHSFHLKGHVFHHFDSFQIEEPSPFVGVWPQYENPVFEPYIVAILIAIAQRSYHRDRPSVLVRLLVTRRNDLRLMDVYTAQVSRRLLRRFLKPNSPSKTLTRERAEIFKHHPEWAASTPTPLILHRQQVEFSPCDTFNVRLLAAMSITATPINEREYYAAWKLKQPIQLREAQSGHGET